jgi:predicted transposase YdaD
MELTTSWKEEGRAEGREEGRHEATLDLVLRQLARRLGTLALPLEDRTRSLRQADLEALAEDLLDFRGPEDLAGWLDRHQG